MAPNTSSSISERQSGALEKLARLLAEVSLRQPQMACNLLGLQNSSPWTISVFYQGWLLHLNRNEREERRRPVSGILADLSFPMLREIAEAAGRDCYELDAEALQPELDSLPYREFPLWILQGLGIDDHLGPQGIQSTLSEIEWLGARSLRFQRPEQFRASSDRALRLFERTLAAIVGFYAGYCLEGAVEKCSGIMLSLSGQDPQSRELDSVLSGVIDDTALRHKLSRFLVGHPRMDLGDIVELGRAVDSHSASLGGFSNTFGRSSAFSPTKPERARKTTRNNLLEIAAAIARWQWPRAPDHLKTQAESAGMVQDLKEHFDRLLGLFRDFRSLAERTSVLPEAARLLEKCELANSEKQLYFSLEGGERIPVAWATLEGFTVGDTYFLWRARSDRKVRVIIPQSLCLPQGDWHRQEEIGSQWHIARSNADDIAAKGAGSEPDSTPHTRGGSDAKLSTKSSMGGSKTMTKILFVSADPTNAHRLRLGKEVREIVEGLKQKKKGLSFKFHESPATRPKELLRSMRQIEPDILQFSGHGGDGALWLEDDAGNGLPASSEALAELFEMFSDKTYCVILNACSSLPEVQAIARHIDYVIGTNKSISDEAAIAFSSGFYSALASGVTVPQAFKEGTVLMGITEDSSRGIMVLTGRKVAPAHQAGGAAFDSSKETQEPRNAKILLLEANQPRPSGSGGGTDPTGRCFVSYKRSRSSEISRVVGALHDHGIPTWQDLNNLDHVHTETRIVQVLDDPATSSAVLWITPDVKDSDMIKTVEAPAIIKRVKKRDGFFALPALAGGLGYSDIQSVLGPRYTHETLGDWNVKKLDSDPVTDEEANGITRTILGRRIEGIHSSLRKGDPLRIEVYTRPPAVVNEGVALTVDWTDRFDNRDAKPGAWDTYIMPSLRSIVHAVVSGAPGRPVEMSGSLVIPAATALGVGFLARRDADLRWKQLIKAGAYQYWSLSDRREPSGFEYQLERGSLGAQDLAVLLSVARDVEPAFFETPDLPAFRAILRVTKQGGRIHQLETPGQAQDVARIVIEGIEEARTTLKIEKVHLFMAVPVGLAFMIGQLLNALGVIQTYELVSEGATGFYRSAASLRPAY